MSSPSTSRMYPNLNTPPTTYCTCCSYPSSLYQQQMPTSPSQPMQQQPSSSSKTTRLQYSNKDRYILNELFKRTPYPNAIQRDFISQELGITSEQIRIWFQNRRRLQTQRDCGERLATANELIVLQLGKTNTDSSELKLLLNQIAKYKNASPRVRLDEF